MIITYIAKDWKRYKSLLSKLPPTLRLEIKKKICELDECYHYSENGLYPAFNNDIYTLFLEGEWLIDK
jgi:hypothetical protein